MACAPPPERPPDLPCHDRAPPVRPPPEPSPPCQFLHGGSGGIPGHRVRSWPHSGRSEGAPPPMGPARVADTRLKASEQLLNLLRVLVRWAIAECRVCNLWNVVGAGNGEVDVRRHSRAKLQRRIVHIDHHVVNHYVRRGTTRGS